LEAGAARLWSRASPRGTSSAPALRAIPPGTLESAADFLLVSAAPLRPRFISPNSPAATVPDACGFFFAGAHP
jgi:hypothetical protein